MSVLIVQLERLIKAVDALLVSALTNLKGMLKEQSGH